MSMSLRSEIVARFPKWTPRQVDRYVACLESLDEEVRRYLVAEMCQDVDDAAAWFCSLSDEEQDQVLDADVELRRIAEMT